MKIYRMNRLGNILRKEREVDGSWTYTVESPDGALIAKIVFAPDRGGERLTNGDLLEIVRDRLRAYNNSKFASESHRTRNAEDRVSEAIYWVEQSSLYKKIGGNEPADNAGEEE